MKKKTPKDIFKLNQITPGMYTKGAKVNKGSHPPKNNIARNELIKSILAYSPKKNNANVIEEYSTLYPETSSASASGKSKGCLLVSANIEIQKTTNIGKSGKQYQPFFWH